MKTKTYNIKDYLAISLEQLLIWLMISSLLILILFQSYALIKKHTLKLEHGISILYKQIVADFFLRSNIQQAGYKGLINSIPVPQYSTIPNINQEIIIPKAPIAVCKATVANCKNLANSKILQKIINHKIKANTYILLAYDIPDKITYLSVDMHNNASPLMVNVKQDFFKPGDQMIISDYKCMQRFIISNIIGAQIVHDKPFNTTNNLAKIFTVGAEVFRTKHVAFYIAKNDRYTENHFSKEVNNKQQKIYSLYMEDLNTKCRAEAILDNIDNFLVQTIDYNSKKLVDASTIGWISDKYILVNLIFKSKFTTKSFTTSFIIRNNA